MFSTRRSLLLFETDEGGIAGQAPAAETPETAGQPGTDQPQQPAVDPYEKRYNDLQPEYTRVTQEAAQLRRERELYQQMVTSTDPDTRRQAAEALGFELEAETDDTQFEDPADGLRAELEALKQTVNGDLTSRQQQEQIAQLETAAESSMDTLQVPKDEGLRDWIVSRAVALPPTQNGHLNIEAAWTEFKALENALKKEWAKTKNTHAFSASGVEGNQAPKLHEMPRDQRDEYLARRLMDLSQ